MVTSKVVNEKKIHTSQSKSFTLYFDRNIHAVFRTFLSNERLNAFTRKFKKLGHHLQYIQKTLSIYLSIIHHSTH